MNNGMDMQSNQNIFNYSDPRQYLLDYVSDKQRKDPSFSVRKWSKEMGLKCHSLLAMILQGKRKIRVRHCDFIFKGVYLNSVEKSYFQTLVQYQSAKSFEEKKHISKFLKELHPGENWESIEVSEFTVISNWIYMTILAMTQLKDFQGTEEEVFERLGGKVTLFEVRSAIVRLLDLKLMKWDEDGNLVPTYNKVTTQNGLNDEGVKEYHRQVSELAKNAVTTQKIEEREFQAFTMAVAKDKIPMAKDMIRRFRAKLSKAVSGNGDNVYQTNIQFFQLTKDPRVALTDENVERGTTTGVTNVI